MTRAAVAVEHLAGAAPPDELSGGLKFSLIVHVAICVLVIVKSLVFPGNPIAFIPALRVDIVDLPDVLKKDLSTIPKEKAPNDISKAMKEVDEELKHQPPPKIKTPPKEMAEPDELVLKPTAQQTKAREKKNMSALDRIKALEKIADEEAKPDKAVGATVKGNKVSKGTSLSPDAKEAAEASYLDTVRDKLQENWQLPVWLARQKLEAKILLRIDSHGQVSSIRMMKPSGNAQFDDAIRKTVQASVPFPPPPEGIADTVSSQGILVGFPL